MTSDYIDEVRKMFGAETRGRALQKLLEVTRDVGFEVESMEITEYTISSSVKSRALGEGPMRFRVRFRIDGENTVKMDSLEVVDRLPGDLENQVFRGYASVVASSILHILQMIIRA